MMPGDRVTDLRPSQGVDPTAAADALTSGPEARVVRVFDSDVFRGASIEVPNQNLDTLNAADSVSKAWQGRSIKLPRKPDARLADGGVEYVPYDVHPMTGVDKLHAAGIFGKGATVAVVDTGIDYNHPAVSAPE